ncbi:MAG: Druantia anti-phage system protein DruA [Candidatus Xenobia bacterium]
MQRFGGLSFGEVVATICENLPWKAPNGELKIDACTQLLLRLAASGVVELPARRGGPARRASAERMGTPPPSPVVRTVLHAIQPVRVEPVPAEDGPEWNAMMAVYHPRGFRRAFGAQQKYWVWDEATGSRRVLGGLLFAAAAKALAVRDGWIGWDAEQRQRYRHRIVSNSRYLLLPDVAVPHLASHVLALALRRLPEDWIRRYGYEPVVAETFVEQPWAGTCYRAANWRYLGETAGRGRQDREHARAVTVKAVWVYPLAQDWRERLMAPLEVAPDAEADA